MLRAFLFLVIIAAPALANTGTAVSEPSDVGLFMLAVVGLFVGRSIGRRPPREDRDDA